ncbi:hypothetical protein EVJ22_06720 [Exiguobacterium sp. SH0S7]|nr:hypothetical protein EVJ22_06720 [Exiguobacterium sp. SH0S7]
MNGPHIKLAPSEAVINEWIKSFMPAHDLYFIDERLLSRLDHSPGILLIPREEFSQHPTYRDISVANSYTYWTVDPVATHVVHAPSGWLTSLPDALRSDVLTFQATVGRGLVFRLTDDESRREWMPYIINVDGVRHLVLQQDVWTLMTNFERRQLVLNYAKEWDVWDAHDLPLEAPSHLTRYANMFSTEAGSNCLAATLFAVTGEDWLITQWVHPKTFLQTLAHASYTQVDAAAEAGDVLTFWDDAGRLQHATYRIDDELFFNKNGQTMFNPWKVIDETELRAAWGAFTVKIYRRTKQG